MPTWNYVAVQVRGRARLLEEPTEVDAMLDRLVAQFESGRAVVWRLADQPAGYRSQQAMDVVGFELVVEEVTGAWKLSQRASAEDRAGVIAGLRTDGGGDALSIARLMGG